jgi:plastocyanin
MKPLNSILSSAIMRCMLSLAALIVPQALHAATWQATVGAQSDDLGRQGWAFLPNELWIHAGDSVTWTFASDEPHTASFLTFNQLRPTIAHDSDVITPSGSSFDGSSYVNSGELCRNPTLCPPAVGNTYTVNFPAAGNFKLVCLAHLYMNGQIHVLDPSQPLPHNQAFYDRKARDESDRLLSDIDHQAEDIDHRRDNEQDDSPSHRVIAGTGEIVTTGAGFQTAIVVRFFPETITVHVGQTVEWTNMDPMTNHSVTFGVDPVKLRLPVPIANFTLDSDGALHATVGSPIGNLHSGALWPLPADRAVNGPNSDVLSDSTTDPTDTDTDLPQFPLPVVVADLNQRYRVTFSHAGTFNYHCAYHDNLGMVGQVIVLP